MAAARGKPETHDVKTVDGLVIMFGDRFFVLALLPEAMQHEAGISRAAKNKGTWVFKAVHSVAAIRRTPENSNKRLTKQGMDVLIREHSLLRLPQDLCLSTTVRGYASSCC